MSTQAVSTPAETPDGLPLPAPVQPDPLSMGAVLRIAPMRRMWYAQIVSVFGDFLALFAVIEVITFQMHGNAQQVTGLQIAYMLPIAVLGVLSGVFVDRWPIKPTLVASDLTRGALCLLLLTVHNIHGFYVVLACISILSSFFSPAQGVAIRSIVPLHGLRSANALLQQAFFIMRIIGPFAAGALVGLFGAKFCYWADSASFLASGTLIASIPLLITKPGSTKEPGAPFIAPATSGPSNSNPEPLHGQPHEPGAPGRDSEPWVPAKPVNSDLTPNPSQAPDPDPDPKSQPSALRKVLLDMREGAGFIFHHAALSFVILSLAAAMFVMGCFGPLIAVYVRDTLHAAIKVFTIASMMIGVGMMIGVNALNALAKKLSNTIQVYGGLLGIAIGTLMMATLHHNGAAYLGCFLIGFSCAGIIVPSQTMIQQETPPALLGRVGSTVMSCIFTAQIAGLLLSGILARFTSVRRVFGLCTLMLILLAIAGKLWMEPKTQTASPA
jgi:DHA3 family macrolide efflux protein-like MFS transporter